MRLTPLVLCLGLAASTLPVAVVGQRPDDQIAPQSMTLLKQGETLLSQGKLIEADDVLETALAVDPKNRAAFNVMARVAIKQQLYGQADQSCPGAGAHGSGCIDGAGRGDGRAWCSAAGEGKPRQVAEAVRYVRLSAGRRPFDRDRARPGSCRGQASTGPEEQLGKQPGQSDEFVDADGFCTPFRVDSDRFERIKRARQGLEA